MAPAAQMTAKTPDFPFATSGYDVPANGPRGLLGRVSVLLVDDQPEEVRLLGEMLRQAGARVLLASDGAEALRLARELRPSLILLDILLPFTDGFAVCLELRHAPATRDIPILFLSGQTDVESKLRAFAAGGRDYITKPFVEAEVLARVALHVDLARRLPPASEDAGPAGRAPPWLAEAVELLRKDLATTPKLAELAYTVGTNPRRLNEEFRARFGLTTIGFLRESRLKEAHRLLMDTDLPIQQIGCRVGYPLPANFATAFRERFGVSPRQLRRDPD